MSNNYDQNSYGSCRRCGNSPWSCDDNHNHNRCDDHMDRRDDRRDRRDDRMDRRDDRRDRYNNWPWG